MPEGRIKAGGDVGGPIIPDDYLYDVVDVLLDISKQTGKAVSQIALNWLLSRPTVCNIVIGARNEEQLLQNLAAVGWQLAPEHIAALDTVSRLTPIYPYWHQAGFDSLVPKPVRWV